MQMSVDSRTKLSFSMSHLVSSAPQGLILRFFFFFGHCTLFPALLLSLSLSPSLFLVHFLSGACSLSLSVSLCLFLALCLSLSHLHTQIYTHTHSHTPPHTHSLATAPTDTHTHTHTHTHTNTFTDE